MREKFEAWVNDLVNEYKHLQKYRSSLLNKYKDGAYTTDWVNDAWLGFQASQNSISNEIIKLQSEVDKADSLWMDWQLRCIGMEKQRNELLFLLREINSSSYGAPPSLFASRILILLPNIRDLINKYENTFSEETNLTELMRSKHHVSK